MRFEFATADRIVFGPGTLRELGALAKPLGSRALVVTGRNQERAGRVWEILRAQGIEGATFSVPGEPDTSTVQNGVQTARSERCDMVISFGGGSAIDAGKAIAAMLNNQGELLDYLEVIGKGKSLDAPPAPFIAIPTTAGTGSEVTRNAVLASPEHRVKVSLRSPLMLPRVALVDPELTHGLPASITASTGLDALTQLIEPFVSCRANPMTDAICREGLTRAGHSLRRAFENGRDAVAREDMSVAALFGGLALANAGLGAVHGFAGPIGGMFPAPHGAVCAALLPHVMAVNLRAAQASEQGASVVQKYTEVARILTGNPAAEAQAGVNWVTHLVRDLQIPGLSRYGVTQQNSDELIPMAANASSMKANPIVLSPEQLKMILVNAL
jgi:alcohol dehydrogenase class IV